VDPIEASRNLLPAWVGWGNLVCIPVVFALSSLVSWLSAWVAIPSRHGYESAAWVDKARLGYPASQISRFNVILMYVMACLLAPFCRGPFSRIPEPVHTFLVGSAAFAGALLVRIWVGYRLRPGSWSLKYRLQGMLTDGLFLWPHLLAVMLLAPLLPGTLTAGAISVIASSTLFLGFIAWGGGIFLARALGLARPASDRLRGVVQRAAARVGVSPRGTYELTSPEANAFALPACQRLAFTDRVLTLCDDEELAAICAHELGHLTESRLTVLGRTLGIWILLPLLAAKPMIGSYGLLAYFWVYVLFLGGCLLLGRLTHRMEVRADAVGAMHQGEPGTYARALAKMYEANLAPAVLFGKHGGHPHLYDRLLAAGVESGYSRPQPPSRRRLTLSFLVTVVLVSGIAGGLSVARHSLRGAARGDEPMLMWKLALDGDGGGALALADLALLRYKQGDQDQSVIFYQAASVLNPDSAYEPANLAIVLANGNRCAEAEAALSEAEARAQRNHAADVRVLIASGRRAILSCHARNPRKVECPD
jgi:Zn-dependent protease with chaperone function